MNLQTSLNQYRKAFQLEKSGFPQDLNLTRKCLSYIREDIAKKVGLPDYLTYEFDGPLGLVDLWQLLKINRPDLKDKSFLPCISPLLTLRKEYF